MTRKGIIASSLVLALAVPAAVTSAPTAARTQVAPGATALEQQWTETLSRARAALAALEAAAAGGPASLQVLERLNDEVLTPADNVLNEARLVARVHPDAGIRALARRVVADAETFTTQARASPGLFRLVGAIDLAGAPPETRHYVARLRQGMRRAGAALAAPERARARALSREIARLGESFLDNIRRDRRSIEIDPATFATLGLPAHFASSHTPDADGKVRVWAPADALVFLTHARSDDLRRALLEQHYRRGHPANEPVLAALLARRHELATLLGYPSWAALALEDTLLRTPEAVQRFIDDLAAAVGPLARAEAARLAERRRRDDPAAGPLQAWQWAYYLERVRIEERAGGPAGPSFGYDRVLQELLALAADLFGLRFRRASAPVWHPSVEVYEVDDEAGPLGRVYLDTQPRDGKGIEAETLARRNGVAGRQRPEAVLIGRYPRPGPLDHRDVIGLFHEFGHVLHVLLAGRQRWVEVAGYNTEWDVTELPAKVFEELARHPAVLRRLAGSPAGPVPSGSPAPLGEALMVARQLAYAEVALRLHAGDPRALDPAALTRQVFARHLPYSMPAGARPELSFGHLHEYGPRYYGYVSAAIFARDIFATVFETAGVVSRAAGMRFRAGFLERGGGLPGDELLARTLGRAPAVEAYRQWLQGAPPPAPGGLAR